MPHLLISIYVLSVTKKRIYIMQRVLIWNGLATHLKYIVSDPEYEDITHKQTIPRNM